MQNLVIYVYARLVFFSYKFVEELESLEIKWMQSFTYRHNATYLVNGVNIPKVHCGFFKGIYDFYTK